MIRWGLPEDLELKDLADYVSRVLKVNILYDQQIASNRVTVKAPVPIPKDSLLGLFESVLKMQGLALADSEGGGWKVIVAAKD